MLTDTQLAQYEEQGAVTIDSPFTTEELDRAEAAWDRLKESGGAPCDDAEQLTRLRLAFPLRWISAIVHCGRIGFAIG